MLSTNDLRQASIELKRISDRIDGNSQVQAIEAVEKIINEIKLEGDLALVKFTKQFDGFDPDPLLVPEEYLSKAWDETSKPLKDALELAHRRIRDFHKRQVPKDLVVEGVHGELLSRRWRPVQKAGIYIPGGRASYPSTVLMNGIPALSAGVEELIMVTPATKDGEVNQTVLAAAHLIGIRKVFRVGGAQAIGALAYGTNTIPKVDVITGPGNIYVTLAKKYVYGTVGIDSLAGPSEVLIVADHTANVKEIVTDLLAQAEHDPLAAAILITTETSIADQISQEINRQLEKHPREKICHESINNWGLIVICNELEDAAKLINEFAPEHLELLIENPIQFSELINNAGAIFVGEWTPEAVGDYLAGPNHTLPTSGAAKFSSALSVETFMRHTSIIKFNKKALESTGDAIMELAKSEGLHSHSESIRIRSEKLATRPFEDD